MGPLGAIIYFFTRVGYFVKSGIDWRRQVNQYEINKSYAIPDMYRFSIFPLDFISVRRSQFQYDNTTPGSPGDYAHTVIRVKDIHPFILNADSTFVDVRSFDKNDPSAFDGWRLKIANGFIWGTDEKFHAVDANHVAFDLKGTPGILEFYLEGQPKNNRVAHTITEEGKAYALAPNVQPNILTKLQAAIHGNEMKYGIILFLIIATMAYIATEEKKQL
jgi:hypothetical protein